MVGGDDVAYLITQYFEILSPKHYTLLHNCLGTVGEDVAQLITQYRERLSSNIIHNFTII